MTDLDATGLPDEDVWFESAGTRLFAAARGSGRPLVLLHGGLATHVSCVRTAAPLLPRYRVIAPDLRGSGVSHAAGPLSYVQLADDVAALLDHLGLARVAIGGFSFGAACAVSFALRHPSRVAALAVMMPAFAGADTPQNDAQRAALAAMAAAGARTLHDGAAALLPLFDALPVEIRERACAIVAAFDPASVVATTTFLASPARPFARAVDLAVVDAPALVVPGDDPSHTRDVALVYAQNLPRARLVDASIADHARVLDEFLTDALAPPVP
jgi:pimeloyl-ACP methyl ester carboxylesterase